MGRLGEVSPVTKGLNVRWYALPVYQVI